MSKRGAISDLNHDNWDEEEEAQEAGTFAQADKTTLQDRVIKKAKRRGITKTDGPSIFAGFGGFKTSVTDSAPGDKPNFDFLKSSNGSNKEFSFGSPPSMAQTSSLVFGSGATSESKNTDNATFSFGSNSSIEPKATKVSFGNGGESTTTANPSGMFSFGSSNLSTSSSATFSFGAKKDDDTAAETPKSSSDLIKPRESTNETDKPKSTTAVSEAPLITNPLPLPKTSKWSCPICMVQNDNDKESCVCCSEPKPGSKAKKSDEVKDLGGSITSSGFKFGSGTASTTPDNGGFKFGVSSSAGITNSTQAASTGFQFGSDKRASEVTTTMPNNKKKEYSQEYLSNLKALNVQVCQWIKTHIEKNPYVFLTPVFKDYEKHLKELEEKSDSDGKEEKSASNSDSASNKPLLGGLFGHAASSEKAAEPVKFGSGSVGFASSSSATPSFTFGSTNPEGGTKGFSFGKSAIDEKTSSDKPSGFSFGSKPEETKLSTGFSFGNAASAEGTKSGFSFASSSVEPETEKKSGFSFGGTSTGFSFGNSSAAANSTGFTFGSGTTTTDNKTTGDNDEEESDEPPKVEVKEVAEDDAYHSVRCKLFYKKEKEFKEKGLGMLHLKKVDKKTQMIVRAETNLGNILLNILVGDSLNITKRKNNLQFGCLPNPPIPGMPEGPAIMLLKVKDSLMADELEQKLNEAIKAS